MPVSDLGDIDASNRGGNAAVIDAAYGWFYLETSQRAAHNPAFFAAIDPDTIVLLSTVTGVASASASPPVP